MKSNKTAQSIKPESPQHLVVGEILRPHGVRGEVRMRVLTDYPEHLASLKSLYIGKSADDSNLTEVALQKVRFHKAYALLTLDGYRSRDEADRLRGKMVLISMKDAIPLAPGEYYLFQLVGMLVRDRERTIGVVKEVLQTGANDVYVVQSEVYGNVLLPAHQETIQSIDFENEVITMVLPDGLLAEE